MRIHRIEVRAFRKLKHCVVDGLGPGLNVLVGDNETGKSTLLAALRAVLFERHRVGGKVLAAMLPHGADVRPEIVLDFALGDGVFRLRKAFNQRPEAELALPDGQTVTGDGVEDRMAALLGFQAPGNRGSRPDEHQGVYGLLWVDQGLAQGPLEVGAGQSSLASALEQEVGLVLGGDRGRHLLTLAEERRDAFWSKHDRPHARGVFRAIQEEVAALEGQRMLLAERLGAYDEKVAALAARTEILARYAREDRLNAAVRAAETARTAALRAVALEAASVDIRRAEASARAAHEAAGERLRVREALSDRAAAAALAVADAADRRQEAQQGLQRASAAARGAADHLRQARERREVADLHLAALDLSMARRKARDDLARARQSLGEAERVAARRRAAAATVAGLPITRAALAELDRRSAALDQARSRHEAASVQIAVEQATVAEILVDGVPHPVGTLLLLSRDATLDLPGFGSLRVKPGGGVEPLARALAEAEAAMRGQLHAMGHPSHEAATAAFARRTEAEAEVAAQDRLSAVLAPAGLEALRSSVEALAAAADGSDPGTPLPLEDRGGLLETRAAAVMAERGAEADVGQAEAAREAAARQTAVLDERAAAARRESEASAHALAMARAAVADDRLAGALAETQHAADLAAAATATAEAALAALDPAALRLERDRAERAEAALRADIERLTLERRDLGVELSTLGHDGLGEQLAGVEGKLAAARCRLACQRLEAEASLLLHRTLAEAQRETKERWLGPVRDRVRPYLRLIQPGSDIVLNEKTFGIEHLVRDGRSEPFESLSVGAREQVAVITRLALADILRTAGQPSAIILDDALVNTDETRLSAMHRVLQKAAENLQVLVLTCREKDFAGLGAQIHRL